MRRSLRAALILSAASATLTACSDHPVSEPTVSRPARVNADVLAACDINKTKKDLQAYVASGSDPIYDLVRSLGQATTADAKYDFGMQALARLALVRSSTNPVLKKSGATAAQGAAAAVDLFACTGVGTVQGNFATNMVTAFGVGGMFEVPAVTSSDPVFSRGKSPFWYAQPATGTWGDLLGKRVALFGYEIGNIPGNLDPLVGTNGFDFNSVPMLGTDQHFANTVLIGACGLAGTNARFKHVNAILLDQSIDCPGTPPTLAASSLNGMSNFASFARATLSMFAPRPAYAAAFVSGIGGGSDVFSPSAVVTVQDTLSFTSQPVNGFNSTVLSGSDGVSVKVLVKTKAGTLIEHAFVTLTITGNSGLNALFFDPTIPGNAISVTRETDVNGIADFAGITVIKAGGYTLTATVDFDGIGATPIPSNSFNIQNK